VEFLLIAKKQLTAVLNRVNYICSKMGVGYAKALAATSELNGNAFV